MTRLGLESWWEIQKGGTLFIQNNLSQRPGLLFRARSSAGEKLEVPLVTPSKSKSYKRAEGSKIANLEKIVHHRACINAGEKAFTWSYNHTGLLLSVLQ